ncbi:hypothetical protein DIC82_08765 [Clostridium beijerinckii]|nr:hypothetical protein DIC82_08765 [Clostridium beijerinckii]
MKEVKNYAVTKEQANALMDIIISKNIFKTNSGDLV